MPVGLFHLSERAEQEGFEKGRLFGCVIRGRDEAGEGLGLRVADRHRNLGGGRRAARLFRQ